MKLSVLRPHYQKAVRWGRKENRLAPGLSGDLRVGKVEKENQQGKRVIQRNSVPAPLTLRNRGRSPSQFNLKNGGRIGQFSGTAGGKRRRKGIYVWGEVAWRQS